MKFKKTLIQVVTALLFFTFISKAFGETENLRVDSLLNRRKHHYSKYEENNDDFEEFSTAKIKHRRHKKAFIQKNQNLNFDTLTISARNNTHPSNGTSETRPGIFPNLTFVTNPNLAMVLKKTFSTLQKCKQKTGLLYYVNMANIKDKNHPGNHIQQLQARPSYVVLNEHAFSVQDNQTPHSLVRAIGIEKILRVTQTFKGTTCFDVIEEKKENKPLQLCGESKDEMDEWIVGILEFKECLLKEKFEIIDANANAFAKTPSKSDIKHGKGMVPPMQPDHHNTPNNKESIPTPIVAPDALYYTNTFTPTSEIQEITETDKALTKILNDKKREELAQRQIKRQIEDKIRKVKEAHKKILLQQRKMAHKNALNKKKEIAVETKKIEDQAKKKEKEILNDALKNMQKMNVITFFKSNRKKTSTNIKSLLASQSLEKPKELGHKSIEL